MLKQRVSFVFIPALTAAVIFMFFYISGSENTVFQQNGNRQENQIGKELKKGPDCELDYFNDWHQEYSPVLSVSMLNTIWGEVFQLPREGEQLESIGSWRCAGPWGMEQKSHSGSYYSGRILAVESPDNGASVRIGAASGGLWTYWWAFPIPLTDDLTSLAIGAFLTLPGDSAALLVGTGEPHMRSGTGLFRTDDLGTTWRRITMTPDPYAYYAFQSSMQAPNTIHTVTTSGYYRSDDGGNTFTRKKTGDCSALVQSQLDPFTLYLGEWGSGVYKSTDQGDSWTLLTGGLPNADIGRVALTLYGVNLIYASIANNSDDKMLGIYKSTDGGANWSDISPGEDALGGQGWYNNAIGVCPTNPDIVLLGGVNFYRTSDGGANWNKISTHELHADHHVITWRADASVVYDGSDGGLAYSNDLGVTWKTSLNWFPITQYVNIDAGKEGKVIFGGSQDNGISGTVDFGTSWTFYLSGDGGGVAVDPRSDSVIYVTLGIYHGTTWPFHRHRSTDMGGGWDEINSGVDADDQWYNRIRIRKSNPYDLYNNTGQFVYQSNDQGNTWTKLGGTAMPTDELLEITVAPWGVTDNVYACLEHRPPGADHSGNLLRVYESGSWNERSTGLPSFNWVRKVVPNPYKPNHIYAIINGFLAGHKLYFSQDNGQNWTNISGDFPNANMSDIIVHPENDSILYAGSGMGCYKTTNSGTNWMRYNNGMPQAVIITEMIFVDSIHANGRYYLLAGSYGRSVWERDITVDDPVDINEIAYTPEDFRLEQNYPNPFNPATTISFYLPYSDYVTVQIFNTKGELVKTLTDSYLSRGQHNLIFDAKGLASGIYLYRAATSHFSISRKMMLLK